MLARHSGRLRLGRRRGFVAGRPFSAVIQAYRSDHVGSEDQDANIVHNREIAIDTSLGNGTNEVIIIEDGILFNMYLVKLVLDGHSSKYFCRAILVRKYII